MDKQGGSYNKTRLKFGLNYKDKIRVAINNSKQFSMCAEDLRDNIGTVLGTLIDEMLADK